jgi:putative ABC transport system substrate-binding protein
LHELVPAAARVALVVNPSNPNTETISRDLQTTADTLGLKIDVLQAGAESEFNTVFEALAERRAVHW